MTATCLVPWLHLLNAIFPEMATAVWAATYLKEVGHASGGLAAAMAGAFGVAMFASRQVVPQIVGFFGAATVSACFIILGIGSLVMVFGGGLAPRVAGLTIVGLGAGPLYPLDVDRLYVAAEHRIDPVSLGAICMLAAGTAITLGPLALGVLADSDRPEACAADRAGELCSRCRHPVQARSAGDTTRPHVNSWMILHVR